MVKERDRVVLTGPNVADRFRVWTVRWVFGSHAILDDRETGESIVANKWGLAVVR
jgi:hypothetical protein